MSRRYTGWFYAYKLQKQAQEALYYALEMCVCHYMIQAWLKLFEHQGRTQKHIFSSSPSSLVRILTVWETLIHQTIGMWCPQWSCQPSSAFSSRSADKMGFVCRCYLQAERPCIAYGIASLGVHSQPSEKGSQLERTETGSSTSREAFRTHFCG